MFGNQVKIAVTLFDPFKFNPYHTIKGFGFDQEDYKDVCKHSEKMGVLYLDGEGVKVNPCMPCQCQDKELNGISKEHNLMYNSADKDKPLNICLKEMYLGEVAYFWFKTDDYIKDICQFEPLFK